MTDSKGGVKVLSSIHSTGPSMTSNPMMQSRDEDLHRFAQTFGPHGDHDVLPKPQKSMEGMRRNLSFDQIWLGNGQQNVVVSKGSGTGIQVPLLKEVLKRQQQTVQIDKDETDRAVPNDRDGQTDVKNLLKHGSLAEIQARSGDLKIRPLSPLLNQRKFTAAPVGHVAPSDSSLRRNVSFDDKMLHGMKQGRHQQSSLLTELLKHRLEAQHSEELRAVPEESDIVGATLLQKAGVPKQDIKPLADASANTKWNWFGVVKRPTPVLSGSKSAVDLTTLSREKEQRKENRSHQKKVDAKRVTVKELNYMRPF